MTVYQLNIKGMNSDQPIGCVYERGNERYLATPYGDEPLTWLAKKNQVNERELLIEKAYTGEKLTLFREVALNRKWAYQTNRTILANEQRLDELGSKEDTQVEYVKTLDDINKLEQLVETYREDSYTKCTKLLAKHFTHLNHANFVDNLKVGVPVTAKYARNYFILDLKLPVSEEEIEHFQQLDVNVEPFYKSNNVHVRHYYHTVLEPDKVRLSLLVNLPEGDKPKLTEHLQPMTVAIKEFLRKQMVSL